MLCLPFNVGGKDPNMGLEIFMQLWCFCWSCISTNLSTICPFDFLCSLFTGLAWGIFYLINTELSYSRLGKFCLEMSLTMCGKLILYSYSRDIILGITTECAIFSGFLHNFKTFNMHLSLPNKKNIFKQKLFQPFISSLMCTNLMSIGLKNYYNFHHIFYQILRTMY